MKRLFLISILLVSYLTVNAQVVGPGDWSSVRLYGHAYNVNGFSDQEFDWIANHNFLFTTEKRTANAIYGDPTSEYVSGIVADQLKANNSICKPLFYWNASHTYDYIYATSAEAVIAHPDWIRAVDSKWDYTSSDFRAWWVATATNIVDTTLHEGVFIDAVPNVRGVQGEEGLASLERMLDQLPGLVIYNGFYTTGGGALYGGLSTLDHADGVFIETFMNSNCNTPADGKRLLDALLLVPSDKYIITNYEAIEDWNATDHTFGLACYLIIANDQSFFRYTEKFDYSSNQLMNWHDDFGKPLGAPLSNAQVNGYVYTRTFENAHVMVDLINKTSSIIWVENPVQEPIGNLAVSIKVLDDVSNDSIPLATFTINGEQYTTNYFGEIDLYLYTDEYAFTLSKDDYDTLNNTLSISQDTSITLWLSAIHEYQLSIKVLEGASSIGLSDVIVFIDDQDYSTNNDGEVSSTHYGGVSEIYLSKTGYEPINQSVDLIKDTMIVFNMVRLKSNLSFKVSGAEENISIALGGIVYMADSMGSLSLVLGNGGYGYTVSSKGYQTLYKAVNLTGDTLITLDMEKQQYKLSFEFIDQVSEAPVPMVSVAINDTVYVTDNLGVLSLVLDYGEYAYTINKEDYLKVEAALYLNENVDTTILLSSTISAIHNPLLDALQLYPNPVEDVLTIENAPSNSVLQMISLSGRLVYTTQVSSENFTISTSQFDKGLYFVRIVETEGSSVQKLMIK